MNQEFITHAARAFFASAWADTVEENGATLRGEIMDQLPQEIDPAATHAAKTLYMDLERVNAKSVPDLFAIVETEGNGDRPNTWEYFAHYCAMQAMGHGVGLGDAFGAEVYAAIRVPYVEFGSYSLEKKTTRLENDKNQDNPLSPQQHARALVLRKKSHGAHCQKRRAQNVRNVSVA